MLLNIITLASYLAGSTAQLCSSIKKKPSRLVISSISLFAICLHASLLYSWIDVGAGQNLTQFNLFSLAIWGAALFIVCLSFKKQIAHLSLFIFPLAAISIALASEFPSHHIIQTASDPKQFIHILLSVVTFSVLTLAGLQAIMLAFQERFLKQKYFYVSQLLPPIETMERMLFQILLVGSILLSAVLASSICFFNHMVLNRFLEKTILSLIAWLVFSSLLIGRFYFGWRGRKAIYWTLGGVALLSTIYFSSIIIMEFIP